MLARQISVKLENQPHRLFTVARALGEANTNLTALTLADTPRYGILRVLVPDLAGARRALMKTDMPARVDEVVLVSMEDRPGSLARLLAPLEEAKVRLEYMYTAMAAPGQAVLVLRCNDNQRALQVMRAAGVYRADGLEAFAAEQDRQEVES